MNHIDNYFVLLFKTEEEWESIGITDDRNLLKPILKNHLSSFGYDDEEDFEEWVDEIYREIINEYIYSNDENDITYKLEETPFFTI